MDKNIRIAIIGGGPAGLSAGMYLEQKGYENYTISNHFCEGMYQYGGTVVTKGGIHTQIITLDDAYANECRVFARMLRTGKMHGTYEQMAQPVFYMDALYRSMQTGEKVAVAQAVVD